EGRLRSDRRARTARVGDREAARSAVGPPGQLEGGRDGVRSDTGSRRVLQGGCSWSEGGPTAPGAGIRQRAKRLWRNFALERRGGPDGPEILRATGRDVIAIEDSRPSR